MYSVFLYDTYYPNGAHGDYAGTFHTLKAAFETLKNPDQDFTHYQWADIFDTIGLKWYTFVRKRFSIPYEINALETCNTEEEMTEIINNFREQKLCQKLYVRLNQQNCYLITLDETVDPMGASLLDFIP